MCPMADKIYGVTRNNLRTWPFNKAPELIIDSPWEKSSTVPRVPWRELNPMSRQRLDWRDFFVLVRRPHGIRVRLLGVDPGSTESLRTEKCLRRFLKARLSSDQKFALRRSFVAEPATIEFVFSDESVADGLAREINAIPSDPPLGWASARELVANAEVVRRLRKMGSEEACRRTAAQCEQQAADAQSEGTRTVLLNAAAATHG